MTLATQRLSAVVAGLSLFACSQGASPTAPRATAPTAVQQGVTAALTSSPGGSEPNVESSGVKPEGFKLSLLTDPRQNENGQIVADSTITVEFDACRSTSGDGSPLYFYFDWDFDHKANVWGGEEACRQTHTYRAKAVEDPKGNDQFRTNVCVATGDVRKHNPSTYVSCREFEIVVPRVPAVCGPVNDNFLNLSLPAGVLTFVGDVSANDCDLGNFVAQGLVDFTNVQVGSLTGSDASQFNLQCQAPGPFFISWTLVTSTGQYTIFASGNCTP